MRWFWIVACLILTAEPGRVQAEEGIQQEYRVVWGGPSARSYLGRIVAQNGTVRLVRNLSVQPSAAGSVVQVDQKTIELRGTPETTFGGMDVSVVGTLATRLRLTVQVLPQETALEYEVALGDLQNQIWIRTMEGHDCRIAIERQIFDKLRVQDDRTSKIFECGEDWPVKVSGQRTGLSSGDYLLTATWARRRNGNPDASVPVRLDSNGSFAAVDLKIKIPSLEGAHQLELALVRPSLVQKWTPTRPVLSRSVELVSFAPGKTPKTIIGWRPMLAVDTVAAVKSGNLSWLVSFANSPLAARGLEIPELPSLSEFSSPEQWNRLLSLSKSVSANGPVRHSGKIGIREFPMLAGSPDGERTQRCVTIEPNAWIAVPLSGLQSGHPHKLRIQVPADRSAMLTILIQDAGDGDPLAISPQQTIHLQESVHSEEGYSVQQEVLFWPHSDSIQIVLASGHRSQPASVGRILVESAELDIPENNLASAEKPSGRGGRNIGLYIDQAFLADCLAAPREKDPKTGRVLESWATWQAVAERMVTHLQLSGANTLILLGASEGGSLFPMGSMQTVPWLDKSTFFSDGRSPQSHDFIGLMLKHLERSGMQLVLEIDPSSNMFFPPHENAKSAGFFQESQPSASSTASTEKNTRPEANSASPSLNPLHPSVQATTLAAIREIVERYKDSPAFAGISIRLRPSSPLVFAGERLGYNLELLEQYAKDSRIPLPKESEKLQAWVSGVARLNFLSWRANQLSKFYQQLSHVVKANDSNLKLYLNTIRLWEQAAPDSDSKDQEATLRNPQQYLLGFGINLDQLSALDGLVLVQGSVRNGATSLASSEWIRNSVADTGASLPAKSPQAAFITHQPRSKNLVSDVRDLSNPFADQENESDDDAVDAAEGADGSGLQDSESTDIAVANKPPFHRLYVDSLVNGKAARQALIDQLFRADQQLIGFGGWYPVWTLEPQIADLVSTFKSLPPVVLDDLPLLSGDVPIRIRQGTYGNRKYLALVNASRWECTVTLRMQGTDIPAVTPLGSGRQAQVVAASGQVTVNLAGSELVAWTWDRDAPEISSAEFKLCQQGLTSITQQLSQLETTLVKASDTSSQRVLFHGSGTFEQWTNSNKPTGWNVSSLPNTLIQRATELPHSGQSAVLIENNNQGSAAAWIQSDSLEIPLTGRLALRAWLRSSAADSRQPLVRLGVIGRLRNGSRYQQSAFYGGQQGGAKPVANDWGRRPAELHIAELPVDDLVELHVAIDLIGQGKIWVDDVEVVETWLHPDERNYLRGQLLVAKQKLGENNPLAAEKILRSQWNYFLKDMDAIASLSQPYRTPESQKNPEAASEWNPSKSAFQQLRESLLERWRR